MSNPERGLISAVIRQQKHQYLLDAGITEDFFHAYPDEGRWLVQYVINYRKAPSRLLFKGKFPDFRILAVDDIEHFCNEVRKNHSKRMATQVVSKAADALSMGDVTKAVEIMHQGSIQVSSVCKVNRDTDIFDDWRDLYDHVLTNQRKRQDSGFAGIPTGFPTFDERTGGLQDGQLIVLAARFGHAKSWSMLRWATSAILAGKTVQFNALEMNRRDVAFRVHAFLSSQVGSTIYSNISLAQGKEDIDPEEYRKFLLGIRKKLRTKFHCMDSANGRIGTLDIRAQLERNEPDIVYIDYITLMRMNGGGEDWLSISKISNELAILTKEYGVPIVVASQLNRNEEIARSDSIGQDADLLVQQKLRSPRTLESFVPKFRHGEGGFRWYSHFEPSKGIFKEISYEEYLDLKDQDNAKE